MSRARQLGTQSLMSWGFIGFIESIADLVPVCKNKYNINTKFNDDRIDYWTHV